MNRIFIASLLILLPILSACTSVGEARAQFCNNLRGVDKVVGELKDSNAVANVGQLREKVKVIRDGLSLAASVAPPGLGVNFDGLIKSLDDLDKATQDLPNDMPIQEALTRAGGAADEVKKQYDIIYNSVCAAQ
jgi:hypothetical protein